MTDRSKVTNIAKARKPAGDTIDDLTALISSRVVGQPGVIDSIVPYVEMFQAGLSPENRPAGVFLLLGPTGTGKTRTVEALAEALHGSVKSMVKIDCGEFQLEHEVAKLIGAPPGYLGHRETQPLLTQQKLTAATSDRSPLSLVLFDEIEKAAPSMTRLLLGVLDRAVLRLGDNSSVSFDKSLIFLTSNLGARQMMREISPDFGFQSAARGAAIDDISRKLHGIGMSAVRRKFSPEFVNRIDQIVTYRPLEMESFAAIVDHEVDNLQNHIDNRLGARAFDLEVGLEARQWLLESGTSLEFGARELKRVIHRNLIQPLAAMVSRDRVPPGCVLRVEMRDDGSRPLLRVAGADEVPLTEFATVLLMQATRDPLRQLERTLADARWEPIYAETIRDAKRVVARNRPHAAVIEADLADGSGVEFARQLAQAIPGIPIVILGSVSGDCQFPVLASPCKPTKVMAALRGAFRRKAA